MLWMPMFSGSIDEILFVIPVTLNSFLEIIQTDYMFSWPHMTWSTQVTLILTSRYVYSRFEEYLLLTTIKVFLMAEVQLTVS